MSTPREGFILERDDEQQKDGADEQNSDLTEELDQIAKRSTSRPVLDSGNPDEILGYDERGLPT